MMPKALGLLIALTTFFVGNLALGQAPVALRCEMQTNPLGIEEARPQVSWQLPWPRTGARQTAYQLLMAEDPGFQKILWDSGKVASDRSHLVEYAGPALASRQRVYWKVRAWDENDSPSAFSEPALWEMGLLKPEDWNAKWIRGGELKDPAKADGIKLWEKYLTLPQIANSDAAGWMDEQLAKLERPPYLRNEFEVEGEVEQARLYISGLGYSEAWLNGKRVSDRILDPGITPYDYYGSYVVHDVTDLVKSGRNAIGVILGGGWYDEPIVWAMGRGIFGQPGLIAQLEVRTKDGKVSRIATDETWKTGGGGLLRSHHFLGESFDATQEPQGWSQAGFDDSAWTPAKLSEPLTPKLKAQTVEPEREISVVKPVSVNEPQPGVWVFDLGELITGYVELRLDGKQKEPVKVRVSEWLRSPAIPLTRRTPDLFYENLDDKQALGTGMILGKARSSSVMAYVPNDRHTPFATFTQTYVPAGNGTAETWKPKFAIQAFRYVEVLGLESKPDLDLIRGIMVHTDTPKTGTFASSDPVLNRVHQAALNSTLQNNHAMSWDNTTERAQSPFLFAWPAQLMIYNHDFARTFQKMLLDLRTVVTKEGKSVVSPWTKRAKHYLERVKNPIAEAATVDLMWQYYLYYGDRRELERHYKAAQGFLEFYLNDAQRARWVEFMRKPYDDSFYTDPKLVMPTPELPFNQWGDHTENYIGQTLRYGFNAETHRMFVTMGHFLTNLKQAEQMAEALDKPEDAASYRAMQKELIEALHEGWLYNPETKTYGGVRFVDKKIVHNLATPSGNAIALYSGMVPEKNRSEVAARLAQDLKENYRGNFYGGHEGWHKIAQSLSDAGQVDWVLDEMTGPKFPQLGYITEQLDMNTFPEGFGIQYGEITTASACQSEFQGIMEWVHTNLSGLETDPANPGFKHFFVRPQIPRDLDWVSTEFLSPYGPVTSAWKKENGRLVLQVNIPANSSATVTLPKERASGEISINGKPVKEAPGVTVKSDEAASPEYLLASGDYTISMPYSNKPEAAAGARKAGADGEKKN
jgi:alpha-L-rhamnosidase